MRAVFVLCLLSCSGYFSQGEFIEDTITYGSFPPGFIWAAATASYQVEGAWNVDGRTPSIWDTFVRTPGTIADQSTGDDACLSYYLYEQDVALLKSMGVSHYRFSISWSRVIPDGVGASNPLGIQYYKNLIAALKAAGIKPMVTLYHWDLPQVLEDQGGWQNPEIATWFEAYADLCFEQFGADVEYWITFNEPWCQSYLGYGSGSKAPGIKQSGTQDYIAAHNQLRSHAKAYRLYELKYKQTQKGKVGITLNISWAEPEDNSTSAAAAAERSLQFAGGWYANPIWGPNGDYPQVMVDLIGRKSTAAGLPQSRLPVFTEAEKIELKGSSDFFGLNFYSSEIVREELFDDTLVDYTTDKDAVAYQDKENWYGTASTWLRITPWGIRRMLNWIKERYNNPDVIITENGMSDRSGFLDDSMRIYFYKYYINNVLQAVQDGVNVIGYTAWSLMDNFEWERGYLERFGMHYVNFTDPARPRIPKASANYYARLIQKNGFGPEEICDSANVY
ncbi:lactase-phlorizin hydrolase-like [Daphnia pulex]|uniref:lactase-phlorizin hydrolase-like n=1 Tax=Daphnia pulex TaxID=6669 RepID=UPI001EDCED3D|nr:lactase-phlorizin hydrolase-like [Daphnia pulex]